MGQFLPSIRQEDKHEMKYEPGQVLWFVPSYGEPREMRIEAVGRLYLRMANRDRIRKDNLKKAGHYVDGTYWPSRAEWEAYKTLSREWSRFRIQCMEAYSAPVTDVDAIRRAAALLGFKEERNPNA
jgi:hypothetical protein